MAQGSTALYGTENLNNPLLTVAVVTPFVTMPFPLRMLAWNVVNFLALLASFGSLTEPTAGVVLGLLTAPRHFYAFWEGQVTWLLLGVITPSGEQSRKARDVRPVAGGIGSCGEADVSDYGRAPAFGNVSSGQHLH